MVTECVTICFNNVLASSLMENLVLHWVHSMMMKVQYTIRIIQEESFPKEYFRFRCLSYIQV